MGMHWFYILLRTYPFWAIPTAFFLLSAALRKGGNKKWIPVALLLMGSSVAFLFYQGHFTAVPFAHEVMQEGAQEFK